MSDKGKRIKKVIMGWYLRRYKFIRGLRRTTPQEPIFPVKDFNKVKRSRFYVFLIAGIIASVIFCFFVFFSDSIFFTEKLESNVVSFRYFPELIITTLIFLVLFVLVFLGFLFAQYFFLIFSPRIAYYYYILELEGQLNYLGELPYYTFNYIERLKGWQYLVQYYDIMEYGRRYRRILFRALGVFTLITGVLFYISRQYYWEITPNKIIHHHFFSSEEFGWQNVYRIDIYYKKTSSSKSKKKIHFDLVFYTGANKKVSNFYRINLWSNSPLVSAYFQSKQLFLVAKWAKEQKVPINIDSSIYNVKWPPAFLSLIEKL